MAINITFFKKDLLKKVEPISSISKTYHNSSQKQDNSSKSHDSYASFKEILDSVIQEYEKGFQKKK